VLLLTTSNNPFMIDAPAHLDLPKEPSLRGWLVVDKPEGISSAAVVAIVKRRFKKGLKIGHAGTLDPLASGVLPLALGEATKTVSYVTATRKTYTVDAVWGEARTTDDAEGEVCDVSDHRPTEGDILDALSQIQDTIMQAPPAYSAIKIGGKRAYALARQGETVVMEKRAVSVFGVSLLGPTATGDGHRFEIHCGPGFYVRSFVRDLAVSLGTVAYARHIRRVSVGKFHQKDAIPLEKLEILPQIDLIREYVTSLESVLDDIPALSFTMEAEKKLRHGQRLTLKPEDVAVEEHETSDQVVVCLTEQGTAFALANRVGDVIKPLRLLID
jgi:tRNA pseudouridine55 synthase